MIEIPYELDLALKTLVNSETGLEYENQELIFMLYKHKNMTWEEIKRLATLPALGKGSLNECISGLWVVGFISKDVDGFRKTYELSMFGRRLLDTLMGVFTV